ncbi:hypothetical protein P692DRAFT_20532997 [Suillus brevipes Sb2]|nr:hypothetical protein P692DRAFT_20532997 [Suillus brevipes Sb2]
MQTLQQPSWDMYTACSMCLRYQFRVQLLSLFVTFVNEHCAERVIIGVHIISLSLALLYDILEMVCIISTPFMCGSSFCWMKWQTLGGQSVTEVVGVLFGVKRAAVQRLCINHGTMIHTHDGH